MNIPRGGNRPASPAKPTDSGKLALDERSTEELPMPDIEKSEKHHEASVETQRRDSKENTESLRDLEKNVQSAEAAGLEVQPDDPFVVFWDSPTDTANPQNWTARQKWGHVSVVSFITLVTYGAPSALQRIY